MDIAQDSSCQLTSECHLSDWMAMMFGVLDNTKSDPGVLEKYRYSVASNYWYGPLAEGFGNSYVSSCCGIEKSFLEGTHLPFNWWYTHVPSDVSRLPPGIFSSRFLSFLIDDGKLSSTAVSSTNSLDTKKSCHRNSQKYWCLPYRWLPYCFSERISSGAPKEHGQLVTSLTLNKL